MREMIEEYGAMAIGAAGAIMFLGTVVNLLFTPGGLIAQLVTAYGNGVLPA